MDKKVTIGMAIVAMAGIAMTTMSTGTVFATSNPQTDDPNFAGEVTSGAATEDGQTNLGEHSASFAPDPRKGLSQAITDYGEPIHPSETFKAICAGSTTQNPIPGC